MMQEAVSPTVYNGNASIALSEYLSPLQPAPPGVVNLISTQFLCRNINKYLEIKYSAL